MDVALSAAAARGIRDLLPVSWAHASLLQSQPTATALSRAQVHEIVVAAAKSLRDHLDLPEGDLQALQLQWAACSCLLAIAASRLPYRSIPHQSVRTSC